MTLVGSITFVGSVVVDATGSGMLTGNVGRVDGGGEGAVVFTWAMACCSVGGTVGGGGFVARWLVELVDVSNASCES